MASNEQWKRRRERERQRVAELRPQLEERHDFETREDPSCKVCGATEVVRIDPGEDLDDLEYRCEEDHRLGIKFWLFPGDHPSMPAPDRVFECDECGDEFVFPFGIWANESIPSQDYNDYRCLDCATYDWLRMFVDDRAWID